MNTSSIRSLAWFFGVAGFVVACGGRTDTAFTPTGGGSDASSNAEGDGPGDDGGASGAKCSRDSECQQGGAPSAGGIFCCGSGTCYANAADTCDEGDDGGSSVSSPAPAPSM
jgi:hypothetical protein